MARLWQVATALIGSALLAGCVTTPPPPLLTPLAVAGSFGYAEAPLGSDRFSVTYIAPPRLTSPYGTARETDAQATRTLAFDMAVWRAAQLAEARGFAGFRITDRRSDVDTYPDPLSQPFDP